MALPGQDPEGVCHRPATPALRIPAGSKPRPPGDGLEGTGLCMPGALGSASGLLLRRRRLEVLLSSLECPPPSRALGSMDFYSTGNLVHRAGFFPPPGKTFQSLFQSVWVSPNLNDIFEVIFTMLGFKNHDHFDFPRLWMALSPNNIFYLGCH